MEKIFFEEDNLKKFLEDRNHEKAKVTGEMEKIFANRFKFTLVLRFRESNFHFLSAKWKPLANSDETNRNFACKI